MFPWLELVTKKQRLWTGVCVTVWITSAEEGVRQRQDGWVVPCFLGPLVSRWETQTFLCCSWKLKGEKVYFSVTKSDSNNCDLFLNIIHKFNIYIMEKTWISWLTDATQHSPTLINHTHWFRHNVSDYLRRINLHEFTTSWAKNAT